MFKGATKPILGNRIDAGYFHGQDGLGDAPDPKAPSLDLIQKESAASAIIRIANENPGEVRGLRSSLCVCLYLPASSISLQASSPQVSLVATAPLTNLALAVRLDPSLPSKLQGLYIMGGNTECQCIHYNKCVNKVLGRCYCVTGVEQNLYVIIFSSF